MWVDEVSSFPERAVCWALLIILWVVIIILLFRHLLHLIINRSWLTFSLLLLWLNLLFRRIGMLLFGVVIPIVVEWSLSLGETSCIFIILGLLFYRCANLETRIHLDAFLLLHHQEVSRAHSTRWRSAHLREKLMRCLLLHLIILKQLIDIILLSILFSRHLLFCGGLIFSYYLTLF